MFTLGGNQDLNNIFADTYHVTITDARGCTAQNSILINQPPQLTTTLTGQNISCYGYSDGLITQIVSGGSAPYSFAWFDINGLLPANTQNLNGLIAGNYQVIVSDFYACTYTSTITLTQPLLPLSSSIIGTDVKCFGDNSGTADLSVEGGTPPYQYSWSNGFLNQDQPNLFTGNYTATVVDTNGCISISTVNIGQPPAPLTSTHISTPVTCYGGSNGAINLTVNGGTTPYSYSWVNSQYALSVISQDITNFPAENYIITITDANQCILIDSAVITEPELLQININPTHILCHGDSSGALDLSIFGGVSNYNVLWNNGVTTQDQFNLFAGFYQVLVNDQNGCFATDSVILTQPAAALNSTYYTEATTCFGFQDGYIFYEVQGGTLPYQFLWSNGDTVSNIFNLTAGIYEITTIDGNNCMLIDSIEVLQPDDIIINAIVTDAQCAGTNTGSIDISVNGGTLPYSYLWMNSNFVLSTIDEDLIAYPAENYVITVTDSSGCIGISQINILEPDSIKISLVASNISCGGANDGSIDVEISGGVLPYSFQWSNGATTEDAGDLPAGVYNYKVTDAFGCISLAEYTLSEVPKLNIALNIIKPSCNLVSDGSVTVEVTNGSGAYTYVWDEGADSSFKYENLNAGEYKLTVTDGTNCSQDTVAVVPINPMECIEIPTAFTPNGDGKNDFWQIKNIDLYPNCKVSIFNSWGNRIFENVGYKEMWDGRFFNNKLPPETYYYIIDLADGKDPKTGTVSIIY
jgi:gliding motility-associated-like protein